MVRLQSLDQQLTTGEYPELGITTMKATFYTTQVVKILTECGTLVVLMYAKPCQATRPFITPVHSITSCPLTRRDWPLSTPDSIHSSLRRWWLTFNIGALLALAVQLEPVPSRSGMIRRWWVIFGVGFTRGLGNEAYRAIDVSVHSTEFNADLNSFWLLSSKEKYLLLDMHW